MAQTTRATVPQLRKVDKLELSVKQELTYGDTMPTADVATHLPFLGDVIPVNQEVNFEGNEDEIGAGVEGATTQYDNGRTFKMPLNYRMSGETAGIIAAFGLGKTTDTDNIDGSYSHAIVPMVPSDAASADGKGGASQLPSMTARLKDGPSQFLADGLCVDSFEIDAQIGKIAKIKAELSGSGRLTTNADAFQAVAALNHLRLTNVQIGVAASEESIVGALRGLNFKWNNDSGAKAIPGSGLYAGRNLIGKHNYEFGLDFLQHSTDTELTNFLANTALKAILTFTGPTIAGVNAHSMIITLYQCRYNKREMGNENIHKLSKMKLHSEYDGSGLLIGITVVNTTPLYLVKST